MILIKQVIHILLLSSIISLLSCNHRASKASILTDDEKKAILYNYIASNGVDIDSTTKVAIVFEDKCRNCVKMLIDSSYIKKVGYTLIYLKSTNLEPLYPLPAEAIIDNKYNFITKTKSYFRETILINSDSIQIVNSNNITCIKYW